MTEPLPPPPRHLQEGIDYIRLKNRARLESMNNPLSLQHILLCQKNLSWAWHSSAMAFISYFCLLFSSFKIYSLIYICAMYCPALAWMKHLPDTELLETGSCLKVVLRTNSPKVLLKSIVGQFIMLACVLRFGRTGGETNQKDNMR